MWISTARRSCLVLQGWIVGVAVITASQAGAQGLQAPTTAGANPPGNLYSPPSLSAPVNTGTPNLYAQPAPVQWSGAPGRAPVVPSPLSIPPNPTPVPYQS